MATFELLPQNGEDDDEEETKENNNRLDLTQMDAKYTKIRSSITSLRGSNSNRSCDESQNTLEVL